MPLLTHSVSTLIWLMLHSGPRIAVYTIHIILKAIYASKGSQRSGASIWQMCLHCTHGSLQIWLCPGSYFSALLNFLMLKLTNESKWKTILIHFSKMLAKYFILQFSNLTHFDITIEAGTVLYVTTNKPDWKIVESSVQWNRQAGYLRII